MTVSPALDRRFREAALAEGALDVAYDIADTPVGPLLVAATDRGLARISFDPDPDAVQEQLARGFGRRLLRVPRAVDGVRRQLDEYFEGRRHDFELELDLRLANEFSRTVLARARHRPVRPPDDLRRARRAGRQAAGRPRRRHDDEPESDPDRAACHRVVGANGSLVGYGGGLERKQQLLTLEGAIAG